MGVDAPAHLVVEGLQGGDEEDVTAGGDRESLGEIALAAACAAEDQREHAGSVSGVDQCSSHGSSQPRLARAATKRSSSASLISIVAP